MASHRCALTCASLLCSFSLSLVFVACFLTQSEKSTIFCSGEAGFLLIEFDRKWCSAFGYLFPVCVGSVTRTRLALSIALTIRLASAGQDVCKCGYEKVQLVSTSLSQNYNNHIEKVIVRSALPLQKFRRFHYDMCPTVPPIANETGRV